LNSSDQTDLQTIDVAPGAWPPRAAPPEQSARAPQRSSRTAPVLAVLIAMVVAGATGYALTASLRAAKDFDTAIGAGGVAPRVPGGSAPSDPDDAVLGDLNVQQSDVSTDITVALIPQGDSVAGATLDLCNGTFPSENLRTARRQVAAVDSNARLVISTESVLYRRPADTAQAFDELRALTRNCPDPQTRFGGAPDGSWAPFPDVERLAFDVNTTDVLGTTEHTVAVYLRRGRVLMGLYFGSANRVQPRVAGERSVKGISGAFASRLAELPAAVING
jgi:hypothetical protein